jgi:hypothetical protein
MQLDPRADDVGPDSVTDASSEEELVRHGCPPFGSKDHPAGSRIMRTNSNFERDERGVDQGDSGERRV